MSLLDRIRGLWRSSPGPDHPLTEEERDQRPPPTAADEAARGIDEFLGADSDPDEPRG